MFAGKIMGCQTSTLNTQDLRIFNTVLANWRNQIDNLCGSWRKVLYILRYINLSYEADLNEGNIWNVELKEKNAENARIVKCEISIYDAFQPDNFGGPVATGRQRCLQDLDELISTAARIKHRRSGTDL